ncbi:MAG: protein-L-isoaspartate(D-aspartate) O-methyltransferase [Actinomycetia bacterium]|nr:protein-L-isoaspartate(D-aspartate) O-methyltransferase [Actinomycetes bacterium]
MVDEADSQADALRTRRERMVRRTLLDRGVRDPRVIDAMRTVPRELFVADWQGDSAYADHPLPIGRGQTISQPYVVALMAEAAGITDTSRVLEVGTGSGYGAAVLGAIAEQVVSLERHSSLAEQAAGAIAAAGFDNVEVVHHDGTEGWPDEAPYDAIVVTAAATEVPEALLSQLADGARLVIPVGRQGRSQHLLRITRRDGTFDEEDLGLVAFVPLVPGPTPDD